MAAAYAEQVFNNPEVSKLLKDAFNNEANNKIGLYYWDKKKATTLVSNGKVTMPNILNTQSDGFIHSIHEKRFSCQA